MADNKAKVAGIARRKLLIAGTGVLAAAALAPSLYTAIRRAPAEPVSRLRIFTAREISRIGTMGGGGSEVQNVIVHLYDTLVTLDPDLQVVESVATSWERISETEWRFHLRDGVRFTNGEACDAHAVAFSVHHIANLVPAYLYKHQWGAAWPPSARVEDRLTVVISTPVVQYALPRLMSRIGIMPAVAGSDPNYLNDPVGSGPYKVVSWVRGRELIMEANEDYFRGSPVIKQLVWSFIPNNGSRLIALRAGDADVIWDVPYERIRQVQAQKGLKVLEYPSIGLAFLTFNFFATQSPVANPRVRKAMTYAIDRVGIRDALLNGRGELNQGPAPARVIGSVDAGGFPERDVKQAKRLLAEAGYPHGIDLTLAYEPGSFQNDVDVCGAVIAQLADAGVRVRFEQLPPDGMITRRRKIDWDITANSVPGSFTGEASYHFYQLKTQQGFNAPDVEAILDEASRNEGEARVELIRRAMHAMWDLTPYLWSVGLTRPFGVISSFEGETYIPVNWLLLRRAHV